MVGGANTATGVVTTIDPRAQQQTEHLIDHMHGPHEVILDPVLSTNTHLLAALYTVAAHNTSS